MAKQLGAQKPLLRPSLVASALHLASHGGMVNPVPAFICCFFLGFFLGWAGGKQAMLEELGAMPSWEQIQADLAREGLQ
jgi:hypothetical protein